MSIPTLVVLLCLAYALGWAQARLAPEAPDGFEPERWRVKWRRFQRHRRSRFTKNESPKVKR